MRPKASARATVPTRAMVLTRAAVLVLTALLAGVACTAAPEGPAGPVTARAPASPPPNGLERAALAADDVPGYEISGAPAPDTGADRAPRADRAACAPLAEVMGGAPDDRARATVSRGLGARRNPGLAVSASLSAYAPPDARRLIERLRTALAHCGTAFDTLLDGHRATYQDVRAEPYQVRGESVSWTATATGQGAPAPVHLVVVRRGATIVRFMAIDLSGRAPVTVAVPHDIADRQLDKLARILGA
ncbi:hypothetical protein N4G70_11355 [Streptomyces sp. ASQP_92]|uniref:hypothetical protein n=1 Tax=Streptomyces sp. ASQP_92 TaxID=2979116 RepID=UPI0021C069EE|nr:hypothetical protein [Streptomyces sp. ASQP_92]MCT9089467.1 hypothetical protein [Streptomyces sp. ASQP_92]